MVAFSSFPLFFSLFSFRGKCQATIRIGNNGYMIWSGYIHIRFRREVHTYRNWEGFQSLLISYLVEFRLYLFLCIERGHRYGIKSYQKNMDGWDREGLIMGLTAYSCRIYQEAHCSSLLGGVLYVCTQALFSLCFSSGLEAIYRS
ncbi:hypothetical protein V8F20_011106 [Naviculisporaceae sp. PSN 640]